MFWQYHGVASPVLQHPLQNKLQATKHDIIAHVFIWTNGSYNLSTVDNQDK